MDWKSAFPVVVRQDESGPCLLCTQDRSRFLATGMSHRKQIKASNPAVRVDVALMAGGNLLRYTTDEALSSREHRRPVRAKLSPACEQGLEVVRSMLRSRPLRPCKQDDGAWLEGRSQPDLWNRGEAG